jgi:hypothetical protein
MGEGAGMAGLSRMGRAFKNHSGGPMSSFKNWAIHPRTGEVELADFIDDFYGRHKYGVRFKDGNVYPESQVKLPKEKPSAKAN